MTQTNTSPTVRCGIIIPIYNSDIYLKGLLNRIAAIQKQLSPYHFSVLVIDDGSNPPIAEMRIPGLAMEWIRHSENRGKGAALKTGFDLCLKSGFDPIFTIDADLQHPPEFIPQFLRQYETGRYDVLVGSRSRNPRVMPLHRIVSNTLTSLVISLLIGQLVADSQCGFRLYSRHVVESIQPDEDRFHLESEMLIRCGMRRYKIGFVSIPTIYNEAPSAIRNAPDTLNFIAVIFRLIKERMTGHA